MFYNYGFHPGYSEGLLGVKRCTQHDFIYHCDVKDLFMLYLTQLNNTMFK